MVYSCFEQVKNTNHQDYKNPCWSLLSLYFGGKGAYFSYFQETLILVSFPCGRVCRSTRMRSTTLLRAAIRGLSAAHTRSINCTLRTQTRSLSHHKTPRHFRGRNNAHVVGCWPMNSKSIRTIISKTTLQSVGLNYRQWEHCIARCCTEEPCRY